ncbi:WD40-repeat-containing domain protein [Naematelia encephala]|uniref:WD40-repeat-containing domain protein n=1 Tax=Naematelia encephala TaxID=71784 RepID=A0A1Y2AV81_9TREE|nr:WD40-repeat-containing domain protein [Naematelia encephala]
MAAEHAVRDVSGVRVTALSMPLEGRRDLALALLWSLPREDVIALNKRITSLLHKDIVGSLPPELALHVMANLSLKDLAACTLVSRTWAKLCADQALWARLCALHDPPITSSHPTWADVSLHRQILHLAQQPSSTSQNIDEGGNESGHDDADFSDPISGAGGMGGGGGLDPVDRSGGVRRRVWEWSSTSSQGLPLNFRTSTDPVSRGGMPSDIPDLAPFQDQPVESHLPLPTSSPSVNYKHLFIANHIIQRRFRSYPFSPRLQNAASSRQSLPRLPPRFRPRAIDAIGSLQAGGLPGHSEAIYSLELIHQRMSITMTQSDLTSDSDPSYGSLDSLARLTSMHGLGMAPPRTSLRDRMAKEPPVFSGREWLLSGSRDHTLRLWQLSAPRPRVVKVFHGGHTTSVLSHFVVRIPDKRGSDPASPSKLSEDVFEQLSPNKGKRVPSQRLMAVSGGGDGRICLWDVEHGDGTPEKVVEAHSSSVLCVRGDDEHVVSCSKDRTIQVFDIHTLKPVLLIGVDRSDDLHSGGVNAVGLSKDYVLSASGDRTIRVWCIKTGNLLASFEAHNRGIASITFDPSPIPPPNYRRRQTNSTYRGSIITGSSNATIKIFHLVSVPKDSEIELEPPLRELTFRDMLEVGEQPTLRDDLGSFEEGQNGEKLIIERGKRMWSDCVCSINPLQTEGMRCSNCMNRGHRDLVRSVFCTNGMVFSGSYDSTIKIWDRETAECIGDLSGAHVGRVFSVVADRTKVVSAGLDCRIVIWDFAQGIDTSFVCP